MAYPAQKNKMVWQWASTEKVALIYSAKIERFMWAYLHLFAPHFLFSLYTTFLLFYQLFLPECLVLLIILQIFNNWPKVGENNSHLRTGDWWKKSWPYTLLIYEFIYPCRKKKLKFHCLHFYIDKNKYDSKENICCQIQLFTVCSGYTYALLLFHK